MTDPEIIALYNARDEAAIRETESAYGRLCHELAMRILGDRSDAEECVSDTWLRVWNAIPPAAPPSLRAYVCKIVRRIAIDRYRMGKAAKRRSEMTVALEEVEPYLAVPPEGEAELPRLLEAFLRTEDELDRKLSMTDRSLNDRTEQGKDDGSMPVLVDVSVPSRIIHRASPDIELPDWAKELA